MHARLTSPPLNILLPYPSFPQRPFSALASRVGRGHDRDGLLIGARGNGATINMRRMGKLRKDETKLLCRKTTRPDQRCGAALFPPLLSIIPAIGFPHHAFRVPDPSSPRGWAAQNAKRHVTPGQARGGLAKKPPPA